MQKGEKKKKKTGKGNTKYVTVYLGISQLRASQIHITVGHQQDRAAVIYYNFFWCL